MLSCYSASYSSICYKVSRTLLAYLPNQSWLSALLLVNLNGRKPVDAQTLERIYTQCTSEVGRVILLLLSLLLLLLLKNIGNARPGEGDCHPISTKTPAPHYQPIEEKKRKGK